MNQESSAILSGPSSSTFSASLKESNTKEPVKFFLIQRYESYFKYLILLVIASVSIATRLYSVIRFESVIHEFDPWFNYRSTIFLKENGWYAFLNWFDERSWYPLGRQVGITLYPGIMVCSVVFHWFINVILSIPTDIREVCVFLAPGISSLTSLVAYAMTQNLTNGHVPSSLFSALFMAIIPGYISRSVAGSYDNEAIAIFLMLLTFHLWLLASTDKQIATSNSSDVLIEKDSNIVTISDVIEDKLSNSPIILGIACAISYYAMLSSWGGYVFIINLIPLHVLSLIVMGKFNHRVYTAYSIFYLVGLASALTIPFVAPQAIRSSEHLGSLGVFGLVQIIFLLQCCPIKSMSKKMVRICISSFVIGVSTLALLGIGAILAFAGNSALIAPWAGRFRSLWDPHYTKKVSPIITSVSEHQPSTWASFFFDLNILCVFAPIGLIHLFTSESHNMVGALFASCYLLTSSYFTAVMIRLMLTIAPIMAVLGGIGVGKTLKASFPKNGGRKIEGLSLVYVPMFILLSYFIIHCNWVTSTAYSNPSVVMASTNPQTGEKNIIDDIREGYSWLRRNTDREAKVLSWWDYGYQLAGMSDRPTIVDNNTWNTTHIGHVGRIMASDEQRASDLLADLSVSYILIMSGVNSGYAGDDMNKFLWMVRISSGCWPDEIKESDFVSGMDGQMRLDERGASPKLKNSILYKMMYWGVQRQQGTPFVIDRARNKMNLGDVNPKLHTLIPVYSSANDIIKIYRVREKDPLGRDLMSLEGY